MIANTYVSAEADAHDDIFARKKHNLPLITCLYKFSGYLFSQLTVKSLI